MPKILIIADLHHKVAKANAILEHEPHDNVIWLGDTFDDFGDCTEDAHRSATWLKDILTKKNHVYCQGNHDTSYFNPFNHFCGCSGHTKKKEYAIWQVLNQDDINKTKFYHIQDGVFFSHAGLTQKVINQERLPRTLNELKIALEDALDKANEALIFKKLHWIYTCGWSRGGNRPFGGLIWNDSDIDFVPTPFPQIFGHTPHPKPLFYIRKPKHPALEVLRAEHVLENYLIDKWWGLDLDTHLNHYAILENGILTIKEISWTGLGSKTINYTNQIFSQKIN